VPTEYPNDSITMDKFFPQQ